MKKKGVSGWFIGGIIGLIALVVGLSSFSAEKQQLFAFLQKSKETPERKEKLTKIIEQMSDDEAKIMLAFMISKAKGETLTQQQMIAVNKIHTKYQMS